MIRAAILSRNFPAITHHFSTRAEVCALLFPLACKIPRECTTYRRNRIGIAIALHYGEECRTLLPALGVSGGRRASHPVRRALGEQREANLVRILRKLTVPATESQMAIALALSVLTMSLMLCAILWQSGVIEFQRDLIRVIWPGH